MNKQKIKLCPDCELWFYQKQQYNRCLKCYAKSQSTKNVEHYVDQVMSQVAWWFRHNQTHPPWW